jgi:hypothetical protein
MAANQVFSIPELLEMILKDLPFKDVLRSTRVNKTFQNTAKVFPRLRRKLFIQQDSDETDKLSVEMEKASGRRWFDHSCSDDESEYDVATNLWRRSRASRPTQKHARIPALHPMLQYIFKTFSHETWIGLERVARPGSRRFEGLGLYENRNSRNHRLLYEEGVQYFTCIRVGVCRHGKMKALLKGDKFKTKAWRGMYVTNRPCDIVVSIGSWKGEYRCPPNTKIEALLKDLVMVHRRRFPHRGSVRR